MGKDKKPSPVGLRDRKMTYSRKHPDATLRQKNVHLSERSLRANTIRFIMFLLHPIFLCPHRVGRKENNATLEKKNNNEAMEAKQKQDMVQMTKAQENCNYFHPKVMECK